MELLRSSRRCAKEVSSGATGLREMKSVYTFNTGMHNIPYTYSNCLAAECRVSISWVGEGGLNVLWSQQDQLFIHYTGVQ